MPNFELNGVVPIIPTPFSSDGGVDLGSLCPLLEFAVSAGVCAACLPAYASEFYKLREHERSDLVSEAIRVLNGRLPLIAQVNHASASVAAEMAREFEREGAAAISVAVPRIFALPERDLLRYFDRILEAISVPLLIQDFNPGGSTVSVEFVKALHRNHEHFRYLKLEEPMMSGKVQSIVSETAGAVGIVEGWGGMYMLELIDAGICGVMPGLGVSDLLQIVWDLARERKKDEAYHVFQGLLPQITYSLQNMEFFHHAEKALLKARGVLPEATVRDATLTVNKIDRAHIDFLNRQILTMVSSQRSPRAYEES
jgi:4-hydroxy-tetrahydrodipicolinate synthase